MHKYLHYIWRNRLKSALFIKYGTKSDQKPQTSDYLSCAKSVHANVNFYQKSAKSALKSA